MRHQGSVPNFRSNHVPRKYAAIIAAAIVKPKLRTYDNPPKEPTSLFFKSTTMFNYSKKLFLSGTIPLRIEAKRQNVNSFLAIILQTNFFRAGTGFFLGEGKEGAAQNT